LHPRLPVLPLLGPPEEGRAVRGEAGHVHLPHVRRLGDEHVAQALGGRVEREAGAARVAVVEGVVGVAEGALLEHARVEVRERPALRQRGHGDGHAEVGEAAGLVGGEARLGGAVGARSNGRAIGAARWQALGRCGRGAGGEEQGAGEKQSGHDGRWWLVSHPTKNRRIRRHPVPTGPCIRAGAACTFARYALVFSRLVAERARSLIGAVGPSPTHPSHRGCLMLALLPTRLFAAALVALVAFGTAPVQAQVNFYDSRAAFEADFPGLAVEDFEEANFPAGPVSTCDAVINSASNDDCFDPGDIIPGVDFTSAPPSNMVALQAGLIGGGQTSSVIGPNTFDDTFVIEFTGTPSPPA